MTLPVLALEDYHLGAQLPPAGLALSLGGRGRGLLPSLPQAPAKHLPSEEGEFSCLQADLGWLETLLHCKTPE